MECHVINLKARLGESKLIQIEFSLDLWKGFEE
jgi:hypothetical protein